MQLVSLIIIRWMEIYPVGSAIGKKKTGTDPSLTSDDVPSLLLSCYLDLVHYLLCIYIGLTASARLLEYECKMEPSPTEKWRRSCSSLRSWRYSVIKGLAAEPRSKKKEWGRGV